MTRPRDESGKPARWASDTKERKRAAAGVVAVCLGADLRNRVAAVAATEQSSMSEVCRDAILQHVDRLAPATTPALKQKDYK